MDLKAYLRDKRALVDEALKAVFPAPQGPSADVVRAMTYSLFAGGKRLRPILCIGRCRGGRERGKSGSAFGLQPRTHPHLLSHPRRSSRDGQRRSEKGQAHQPQGLWRGRGPPCRGRPSDRGVPAHGRHERGGPSVSPEGDPVGGFGRRATREWWAGRWWTSSLKGSRSIRPWWSSSILTKPEP